jgi:hypothetical protein
MKADLVGNSTNKTERGERIESIMSTVIAPFCAGRGMISQIDARKT